MGLHTDDTVIERRLAQRVELLAQNLITPEVSTDDVLTDWYAANSSHFKQTDLGVAKLYF